MTDNLEKNKELLNYTNKIVAEIKQQTVLLEEKISEKDSVIKTKDEEINKLNKQNEELQNNIQILGDRIGDFDKGLESFKKSVLDKKEKEISDLRVEVDTYKNYKKEKENLETKIAEFKEKLDKKDKDKKKYKKLAKTFKEFMRELNEVSVEDDED